MFCEHCGSYLEEGAKFCTNCGTNVDLDKNDKMPPCPKCTNTSFTKE